MNIANQLRIATEALSRIAGIQDKLIKSNTKTITVRKEVFRSLDGAWNVPTHLNTKNWRGEKCVEWPEVSLGEVVDVYFETSAYTAHNATVTEVTDADHIVVSYPEGTEPTPAPLPISEGADGIWATLNSTRSHAHCRWWRTGDVVREQGSTYKVKQINKEGTRAKLERLEGEAAEKAWHTRPVVLSPAPAYVVPGLPFRHGDGWVVVGKYDAVHYHEDCAPMRRAIGAYIPEDKARKAIDKHPVAIGRTCQEAARTNGAVVPTPDVPFVALIPPRAGSLAASGVSAHTSSKTTVLIRLAGDPDQSDSWRLYTVQVEDADLARRVGLLQKTAKPN